MMFKEENSIQRCADLGIVVLNYNCVDDTLQCVNVLLKFELPYHIVIVDNYSTDFSYDKLISVYAGKNVDIIRAESNKGYSAGNNIGIKYVKEQYGCKYCAILNPDVIIPDSNVIISLLDTISSENVCAVIGAITVDRNGYVIPHNSAWTIPSKWEFIRSKFVLNKCRDDSKWKYIRDETVSVECIAGCFFIASVKALEDVGFLDEDIFLYNEELLLGNKLKNLGYKEFLKLDCVYYHMHKKKNPPTLKTYIGQRKVRFASDIILYKKVYNGLLGLILLYLIEIVNRVVLFPWFLLKPIIKK